FRTHAGKAQELEYGGFVLLEKLLAERHGSCCEESLDVGDHAFADAGDGEELLGVFADGGELGGLLLDGLGCAAVGADTEGICCVDLEEGSSFVEESGDRNII